MNLIEDWRLIIAKAWSVRLALLAAVFSQADTWIPIAAQVLPGLEGFMSPSVFTKLSAVLSVAAVIARVLPQKTVKAPPEKDSP